MKIESSRIVVTGAAHGIGRGLVEAFLAHGAQSVVVSDLDADAVSAMSETLGVPGRPCDVGDQAALAAFIDWAEETAGPTDLFCGNPAVFGGPEGGNLQTSAATWDRSWRVNVLAHVWAAQCLVPRMLRRGGGHFLQTLSAAALITGPSELAYTVTKHAALGFAEWLALNYSDKGIRVSCLCPTAVETRTVQGADHPGIGLVQTPVEVAEITVAGLAAENFLILPNPRVGSSFRNKADDYDRWLAYTTNRLGDLRPPSPFTF
ncbi:SDR family oxidoreductase [Pseudofrankia sp. BMG5.37]|uniref:SDR family NAD(P)-dependent oxidoreductase n=1 Tax=Pseudofrankia sp. BMG5.37 TaxID=3050035 RepID=UPI002894A45E|nr:SDR family oxidoreductase [Pseudofrankia sp. BMG5.37]MDT3441915.1 SDR family oxidoreductase [Pseudofrankia sp. BMG5.37]